jgi:hypothetical protein
MPSRNETPHRIVNPNRVSPVASETRDHVAGRKRDPRHPIGPVGMKAVSASPALPVAGNAKNTAKQIRDKQENLARNQSTEYESRASRDILKREGEGDREMWKVWSKALDQIQDQQKTIFALQERHVRSQEKEIKGLKRALKRRGKKEGGLEAEKKKLQKKKEEDPPFIILSLQDSLMSSSITLLYHSKYNLMGLTEDTVNHSEMAPPVVSMPFQYIMLMPVPGSSGAPCFRGKNVT